MKLKKIKNRGFTLIELLVVIAIIGLLASVVLIALSNARSKGRDAKRRADLKNLSSALELYFNDNNAYPNTGNAWWGNCSSWGSHDVTGSNGWIPNLAPTYVGVLPVDPKPAGTAYCYLYRSTGTDYMLLAYLTVENCANISSDSMKRPANPTECDYAIYTSGASNW